MSVLIKGMKMPDCCNNCEFHWEEDVLFEIMHQCQVKTGYINNADIHSFPYDCPLVELPEKHGRLIDEDALPLDIEWNDIEDAPTVIEAEGAEE